MSLGAKSFYLDVVEFPNIKMEDFNTLGHDPRMLKTLGSTISSLKTYISKLLIFWGHVPGS